MANRLWPLLVTVAVLTAGCGERNAAESNGPAAVPTVLILDASGSMNEVDAPGPRIDAAKRAVQGLADALPDSSATALLVYGIGTGSEAEKSVGCQDVKVLIPMGPLNREEMAAQISGLSASGYTPISLALRTAVSQLPSGDEPQAIILVSDGEDTCGAPPCDTAKETKQKYPSIAISTVGFKTEGNASDQLRCIAEVTGGLFVQAQNASQLAARLLATQNVEQAQSSLSSNGIGDITLGANLSDIRKAHPDFPDAPTTDSVVVVYRNCDFGFVNGVLDSIAPHSGGRTIDGVTPGTPISRVIELYGNAVKTETDGNGGYRLTFTAADSSSDAGYRVVVDNPSETGGTVSGTVRTIVLCRCAPHSSPPSSEAVAPDGRRVTVGRIEVTVPEGWYDKPTDGTGGDLKLLPTDGGPYQILIDVDHKSPYPPGTPSSSSFGGRDVLAYTVSHTISAQYGSRRFLLKWKVIQEPPTPVAVGCDAPEDIGPSAALTEACEAVAASVRAVR